MNVEPSKYSTLAPERPMSASDVKWYFDGSQISASGLWSSRVKTETVGSLPDCSTASSVGT